MKNNFLKVFVIFSVIFLASGLLFMSRIDRVEAAECGSADEGSFESLDSSSSSLCDSGKVKNFAITNDGWQWDCVDDDDPDGMYSATCMADKTVASDSDNSTEVDCDENPGNIKCLPGIDLTFGDVYCIFLKIMTWIFSIALVMAIVVLIINGLRYVLSTGDSGAISKVHKNLSWALVGIVVILLSASILIMIANFLGVFTASFEAIILPAEVIYCDVVWWADLIGGVFDWLGF